MNDMIKNGSFAQGFEAGYRAVLGTIVPMIPCPPAPPAPPGLTPYLLGIRAGIDAAAD